MVLRRVPHCQAQSTVVFVTCYFWKFKKYFEFLENVLSVSNLINWLVFIDTGHKLRRPAGSPLLGWVLSQLKQHGTCSQFSLYRAGILARIGPTRFGPDSEIGFSIVSGPSSVVFLSFSKRIVRPSPANQQSTTSEVGYVDFYYLFLMVLLHRISVLC